MKRKVAFITGITGQDGSLLAKFLLKKNYVVHGLKRRASSFNTGRIDSIYEEHQLKNRKRPNEDQKKMIIWKKILSRNSDSDTYS